MEKIKRKRLSAKERKIMYEKYDGRCAYCGCKVTFRGMQIDHIVPLARGGLDELSNMTPACRSCNHYKHTMDIEEFRTYLEGIPKRLERDSIAYQVGLRFGLVKADKEKVVFYFEKVEGKNKEVK